MREVHWRDNREEEGARCVRDRRLGTRGLGGCLTVLSGGVASRSNIVGQAGLVASWRSIGRRGGDGGRGGGCELGVVLGRLDLSGWSPSSHAALPFPPCAYPPGRAAATRCRSICGTYPSHLRLPLPLPPDLCSHPARHVIHHLGSPRRGALLLRRDGRGDSKGMSSGR